MLKGSFGDIRQRKATKLGASYDNSRSHFPLDGNRISFRPPVPILLPIFFCPKMNWAPDFIGQFRPRELLSPLVSGMHIAIWIIE